ncbi:MAG: hypothetical protein H0W02_01905 [Ktedonobacteraceae bacterium]|nr:hypothetical protein [Ktedonobacteraceae bacterium]
MTKAKIHVVRFYTDLHALCTQKQALDTARECFSDLYTDVDRAHCLETCTILRAFREVIGRWTGTRATEEGCPPFETLIVVHYLDEKTTDCLLRVQAFREDYRQLRTYARLQEQHSIYTSLTALIEGIEKIEAKVSEIQHEGTPTEGASSEHDSEREDGHA